MVVKEARKHSTNLFKIMAMHIYRKVICENLWSPTCWNGISKNRLRNLKLNKQRRFSLSFLNKHLWWVISFSNLNVFRFQFQYGWIVPRWRLIFRDSISLTFLYLANVRFNLELCYHIHRYLIPPPCIPKAVNFVVVYSLHCWSS